MPVAPPPNDEYGFWPLVQSLVAGAEAAWDGISSAAAYVFAFPDADEDALREVLAVAWDDLSKLATDIGTAAGDQLPITAVSWPDYAGGSFGSTLGKFAGTDAGGAKATADAAHQIADMVRKYAAEVKYTKDQIVWEVAVNLGFYAATFAGGPAGWAAGAAARWLISRGTARAVSTLLERLALKAAASTFPRVLGAPLTLKTLGKELGAGMIKEAADELLATIPPLIHNNMLNTDFGRDQILQAGIGGGLGDPVSRVVRRVARPITNTVGRGLDRVPAPNFVRNQANTFVNSFGINAISSPISSNMANNIVAGNWAGLVDGRGYLNAIGDNWLSSGAHGTLRANGVEASRVGSQIATVGLQNHFGGSTTTALTPQVDPAGAGAVAPGNANSVAHGNASVVNTSGGHTNSTSTGQAADLHHQQAPTQARTDAADAMVARPPQAAVTHHDNGMSIRPGDTDGNQVQDPTLDGVQDQSNLVAPPPISTIAPGHGTPAPATPVHTAPTAAANAVPTAHTSTSTQTIANPTATAPTNSVAPTTSGAGPAGTPQNGTAQTATAQTAGAQASSASAPPAAAQGASAQSGPPQGGAAQGGALQAGSRVGDEQSDGEVDNGIQLTGHAQTDQLVAEANGPRTVDEAPAGRDGTKDPNDNDPPAPPPRHEPGVRPGGAFHPHAHGTPDLFSAGAARSNQDVIDNGGGLDRTAATVAEAAEAGGIDLSDVEIVIVTEADEIRYLDYNGASACTPPELGGRQIRLGPASFADRATLVATLAHEKTHVDQLRSGADVGTDTINDLENEAYASEAPALERMQAHDADQVHDRDDVRSPRPGRDPGPGPVAERGDPGPDDASRGGYGPDGPSAGRGTPLFRRIGPGSTDGDPGDRSGGRGGPVGGDGSRRSGLTPPLVIQGVAKSLLWFSGTGRLLANWEMVQRQIHAAFGDQRVLDAAGIKSVDRVAGSHDTYVVTPAEGTPFTVIVRAAAVADGHPGEFVVRADGSGPATLTVSDRAKDTVVPRTVANLLHQLANAGRPAEPALLRPDSDAKQGTVALSREDGGRLAEARLLAKKLEDTRAIRAVRRQNIQTEIRALIEHLGLAHGQEQAKWRRSELAADGPLIDKLSRGWTAGDKRARLRVFVAKEMLITGLPGAAGAVGLAVIDSVGTGLQLGVPAVAVALLSGVAARWLDRHKSAAKSAESAARLRLIEQGTPGVLSALEGSAAPPVEPPAASKFVTAKWKYRARHWGPSIAGVAIASALAGGVPLVPALFFAANAAIRPLIDRFTDGRRKSAEQQRFEAWLARVAADPARYENELIAFLDSIGGRLDAATTALARRAGETGGLDYGALARTELSDQLPALSKRAVPSKPDPTEAGSSALAGHLSAYVESLMFGLVNSLAAGLAAAGVSTVIERRTENATDQLTQHNHQVVESAESHALFEAFKDQAAKLVALAELVERLAADPASPRLVDRILDRFRAAPPPAQPTVPGPPVPRAGPDPAAEPRRTQPFWVQSLMAVPPLVTLGVATVLDRIVGLGDVTVVATLLAAAASFVSAPFARWVGDVVDARHGRHATAINLDRAVGPQELADKLGVLMFLGQLQQRALEAQAEALRPGTATSTPLDVVRAFDRMFRIRPTAADFTSRVRAAVRAARLTIMPVAGESRQERAERHVKLDQIEQAADRVDEAIESLQRNDPGAKAVLRAARAGLMSAIQAHTAEVGDGRGRLPDLASVDPATGQRTPIDPVLRARAAVSEANRRMLAEPNTTPYRLQRVIALARVQAAVETLARELARGDRVRVKLAFADLTSRANALKLLQRRAGVAGDPTILGAELAEQVKAFLRRPSGNAEALGDFVADGPLQDHAELLDRVLRALRSGGLARFADLESIDVFDGEAIIEVTTRDGDRIVIRFEVGPVADGHPAEYHLTGDAEDVVVRVSDRIKADDVTRALVHELREVGKRGSPDQAFTPHEQGRIGELHHLDEELQVAEHFGGRDPVRRRLFQQKMQELIENLQLTDPGRLDQLDAATREVVERNSPHLLLPYEGPVNLSEEQIRDHVIPRHGYGTAPEATKFRRGFDFGQLPALAEEVVRRAPVPTKYDPVTGAYAHEYDFGPEARIGASGTGKVRVWMTPDGTVGTIHPRNSQQ
ncbi:hypothetical protein GCM10029976_052280 [Kribbella albertanoniae]|uniref:Outer membrane channel protein CpnT-like N-terminal domain-containing protein n=1 Tax=Kribbella albertanoniae TaxID=1266829 RepID=A0A4R4Q5R3_9ACTN|nr:hypothetical protein [Kribbella albertanoniae]TDC30464.1 hypothetical protein E1261_13345 [Kribbella albertanoniae]